MLNDEQKVGLVFVAGIGLLIAITLLVSDFRLFGSGGYPLTVTFKQVHGLNVGDNVRLGGMKIGAVSGMRILSSQGLVEVELEIDPDYQIIEGSAISIEAKSMLGGNYVAVELKEGGSYVRHGDRITGAESATLNDVIRKTSQVMDNINQVDFAGLSTKAASTLAKVNSIADDVSVAAKNISLITDDVRAGKGTLGKLVTDETVYKNFNRMGEKVAALAENIDTVVEENKANIKQVVDDLAETVPEVKKTFTRVSKIRTVLGVDTKYNSHDEKSYHSAYLRIEPDPTKFYQIGMTSISSSEIDAFESARGRDDEDFKPRISLQIGKRFSMKPWVSKQMTLRAGMIEGRMGAGIEMGSLQDRWRVIIEGRDVWDNEEKDKALLRAYLSLQPIRSMKYLRLYVGGDSLLEDASFMAGAGFEYSDEDLKYLIGLMGAQ